MIIIRIKETGLEKAQDSVKQLLPRILTGAEIGLNRGLQHAVGVSQRKYFTDYVNNTRANRRFIGPVSPLLRNQTRTLRNSITHSTRLDRGAEKVVGAIGTNVVYGRIHELGFRGTVSVAAHSRRVRDINWTAGGGRETDDNFTSQEVKAHTRWMNYAGRPYLRPAVRDSIPIIIREIRKGIAQEVNRV